MANQPVPIPWLPAEKSPWGVAVLDVRPVTQHLLAASSNPAAATNAVSYGGEDGLCFVGQQPESPIRTPIQLRYRRDRLLADGPLFAPAVMEHKWAIFHHADQLLFVRSWQRCVVATAKTEQSGDHVHVTELHGCFTDDDEGPEMATRTLDYLLRSHAMGRMHPVPIPVGLEQDPQAAARWCFAMHGRLAHVATPHRVALDPPDQPLRSYSILHIAIARGDLTAAAAQLTKGTPVDLLAGDGLAALHWAMAKASPEVLAFLRDHGANVDVRSAEGATPLMNAAQNQSLAGLDWLLAHGAKPNLTDQRGFTALHRAAEFGHMTMVEHLLGAGADGRIVAMGHTAHSLASQRGHTAIADRLRLG